MLVGNGKVVKLQNGKKLGIIRKDKTFVSFRTEKKHLFRMYNGWAFNKKLLEELKDIGVEWIEIQTYDTKMIYRTLLEDFFKVGIVYKNTKGEKDIQIILPLRYWNITPQNKREAKKIEKKIKSLGAWLK